MEDLKSLFDPPSMKGLPHEVQYMAGQRDVYKYLELLQTGEMIDE